MKAAKNNGACSRRVVGFSSSFQKEKKSFPLLETLDLVSLPTPPPSLPRARARAFPLLGTLYFLAPAAGSRPEFKDFSKEPCAYGVQPVRLAIRLVAKENNCNVLECPPPPSSCQVATCGADDACGFSRNTDGVLVCTDGDYLTSEDQCQFDTCFGVRNYTATLELEGEQPNGVRKQ